MILDGTNDLLNVIKNKQSPRDEVLYAFARLHVTKKDIDFTAAIDALCTYHPHIAKERLAGLPERFIPKDLSFAVDGYIQ